MVIRRHLGTFLLLYPPLPGTIDIYFWMMHFFYRGIVDIQSYITFKCATQNLGTFLSCVWALLWLCWLFSTSPDTHLLGKIILSETKMCVFIISRPVYVIHSIICWFNHKVVKLFSGTISELSLWCIAQFYSEEISAILSIKTI